MYVKIYYFVYCEIMTLPPVKAPQIFWRCCCCCLGFRRLPCFIWFFVGKNNMELLSLRSRQCRSFANPPPPLATNKLPPFGQVGHMWGLLLPAFGQETAELGQLLCVYIFFTSIEAPAH